MRLILGSMPGKAASTVETCVFGSAPNSVAAPENSFERDTTWACTSSPITTSQEPVRPSIMTPLSPCGRARSPRRAKSLSPCGRGSGSRQRRGRVRGLSPLASLPSLQLRRGQSSFTSPLTFPSLRDGPLPLPRGERSSGALSKRYDNRIEHTLDVLDHLVIPESQNAKPIRLQAPRALLLIFIRIGVLAAIDLDHQPVPEADEVDDIALDRLLAAEFGAGLVPAQYLPNAFLGIGRGSAQRAGDRGHRADPAMNCGFAVNSAARSMTSPARSTVASSKARPMICNPKGRPSPERPAGTEIAGKPARLTGTVNTSFKYMAMGSSIFSPTAKAADGAVGVSITSQRLNASAKSRAMSVRTRCAFK